jgi:hypothetical protein
MDCWKRQREAVNYDREIRMRLICAHLNYARIIEGERINKLLGGGVGGGRVRALTGRGKLTRHSIKASCKQAGDVLHIILPASSQSIRPDFIHAVYTPRRVYGRFTRDRPGGTTRRRRPFYCQPRRAKPAS